MDLSGDKNKQEDGLAHAAQGLRNTSQDVLGKKMVENRKLKEELKLLRDELAAKETTRKDIETKLDKRDNAHNQHLEARLSDIRAAHKIELEAKEASKEKDRQTAADELAKRETELKDDLKNKDVEYQNALTQKEKDRQTAADELGKREAELREDLKNKDVEYQSVLKMFVAKDAEFQNLNEEMSDKETVAKTFTHDLEEKLKQLELQLKDAENKHKEQLTDKQAEHTQTVEGLTQQVKDELEKLTENHKSEITKAEDKLKAEHEGDINQKALQIEKLSAEVETLQQEVQHNRIQFEQTATAAVKEARQMNDEEQRPTEKLRAQIEEEVEEQHHERVAKEMAEALAKQAQELIHENEELASKLKYKSEQRAKQLQEEHDEKVTELTRKHNEESRNQKKAASEQARKLEQTYLTQLENARKQRDQVVLEMTQGQGASQGSLKAQIETEIEAKYQQKIEESLWVKEEELTRQANEIEHLSQQLKNAENEIQKVQESKKTIQDAEHLLMQEAKRREQEIEQLKNELKSQVEILARFEHENEYLKGQCHQLEVHTQAKQELSEASSIPRKGDVSLFVQSYSLACSHIYYVYSLRLALYTHYMYMSVFHVCTRFQCNCTECLKLYVATCS